jgi:hypothetical protein
MTISASTIREIIASSEAGWTVPEIEANVNGYDEIKLEFDLVFDDEPAQEPVKLLSGGVFCNFYTQSGEPDIDPEDIPKTELFSL